MGRDPGFNERAPRVSLRRPVIIVHEDGFEASATVLDVSSGGFRLEVTETPRIGEFVTLHIDRGEPIEAQIRWALGNEAGGVFLTPADHGEWRPEGD
jgi:hypothetical protein